MGKVALDTIGISFTLSQIQELVFLFDWVSLNKLSQKEATHSSDAWIFMSEYLQ